jgi:glyoxylase-like metal-dependent hydrolase (beta-lactamase superfamily II)
MLFRQLQDPETKTYTYLLADPDSREAVLIDPVAGQVERDLALLDEHGLTLALTLETHIHADHITGAAELRQATGCRVGVPAVAELDCADVLVREGEPIGVGALRLAPLFTPGHTNVDHSYRIGDRVFTGDTLFIDGCGRTDFQAGNAGTLYDVVHAKLFTLPDDTLVYPGHDYQGRRVSTIAQEKERNPRLNLDNSREDFIAVMDNLDLPYPKQIDRAVPANQRCGVE